MMDKYLILYGDDEFISITADSLKECITSFAIWCGDDSPLFEKAMLRMETPDEIVGLFERFSYTRIQAIMKISETVYGGVRSYGQN